MALDTSRFAGLTTEALLAIKAGVESEIERRFDRTPRVGRTASFKDGLNVRFVEITKVNYKTVSCRERGNSVEPGKGWKVALTLLNVDPVERRVSRPVPPPVQHIVHRPATTESAW